MQGQLQTATFMQKEKWVLLKIPRLSVQDPSFGTAQGPSAPALSITHVQLLAPCVGHQWWALQPLGY